MEDPKFAAWFNDSPEAIQDVVRKYPPGRYKVKAGAPYAFSYPGTTVYIESRMAYKKASEIVVILKAADMLPQTIDHIETLYNISKIKDTSKMFSGDKPVHLDPEWLEEYYE